MERHGLRYSTDFILGLPGETEADILAAIDLIAGRRGLVRASLFWLCYLPEVAITQQALNRGIIDAADVARIADGGQENYLSTGSVLEPDRQRFLKQFQIIFRLLPIAPGRWVRWILERRVYRLFRHLPNPLLTALIAVIDVLVSLVKRDYYANFMMRWVLTETWRRLWRRNPVLAVGPAKVATVD